ncbi:MAG TPA: polysaccharide biosynthesis C-terminal domain-containing protein [Prolixibacteraceae bacterium]
MLLKSRINSISALQIFQVLRYSTLMLIGIVFAKSGLSISEIGQYETFLLIAGAVSFFWLNGLIQGFLPLINQQSIVRKSPQLFNVFYLVAGLSVLSGVFLIVFEHSISGFLLKKSVVPYLNYLLIYLVISTPASLIEYIYLLKNQGKQILWYGAISFFLMFFLVIIPPVFGFGIEYSLAGLTASAVIRLGWLLVLLFQNSSPAFDGNFIRTHLRSSSPLILSLLLSGSAQYIDSFIVTSYFDDATFAVFRFGAREFPLVLLMANAFSISMLPAFADPTKLKLNLENIKLNAQKLGDWMFPLSALLMLVSHWAFPVVFRVGFSQSATIFNIYLLLIVSRLLFPQTILIGMQKNKLIMWASFLEIIVNVASSLCFVQIWGLTGVAYGTLVAYLFEKLFLMVFVSKSCHLKVSSYLNVSRHLVYSLFLTAEFIVIEYLI